MEVQSIEKPPITKNPLFLVAPFFFLGTAMVVMKFIIPNTTPLFLAAFRLLPAGTLILLGAAYFQLPQPKTVKAWLWIALFALVDGAMFQGFLTAGLVHTGAGIGAVLIDAQPLVVALLSRWLFAETIGVWGWLGLSIGIAGICLCGLPESWIYGILNGQITFSDILQSGGQLTWSGVLQSGELLMLLSALSMSFGTIIVRYVKKHVDPIVATGWHMILGGIPLILLSYFWETNQISNLHLNDWMGLSYATIFGTAITYGIFFYLAATGNITSVSALIFLTPVFALLFSSLLLEEKLNTLQWIGVSFTLVSVYLVNQRQEIVTRFDALKKKVAPVAESIPVNAENSIE
ncbi:DMT family transporter [Pannus brasiliensis CCIBt3594]|uniref:DMT family transporter n=1 Tax=Pannus brasiliensis CCIBt3594 TaxID=1427578 RepID=A0AAW9QT88_9CHRO